MENKVFSFLKSVGVLLGLGLIMCSCASDQLAPPLIPEPPEPAYIGSTACANCHTDIHTSFLNTGHPYILSEPSGGGAPQYPFTSLEHLPAGYTWDDISYVIGGYNWKANYIDANGYIITGDDAQWNFETEEAVAYHENENPGTKTYDCGRCHTTGWVSVSEGGNPTLEGMDGSFFAGGVQCEACHGMGSVHEFTKSGDDIEIEASAEFCGTCHSRNANSEISAMDGFIQNYQQYSELSAAGHSALSCVDCHDPHKTTKHGEMGGIVASCTECHSDVNNKHKDRGAECVTCHMSHATKSAIARTAYQADVKTHIFKINTAADGQMFNEDGTVANGSAGVTLDLVCYQCHRDPDGVGGRPDFPFTSRKSLQQLSDYATGYHD